MKQTIKLLTIVVLLLTIITTTSCKDALKEEYNRLEKNHVVSVLTPKELVKKIENKDTFIVMLGFPACPWCQQLMPVYDEVAKEYSKTIQKNTYYCDLKDMRDNEESKDKECYEFLYEFATVALDTSKDRINAPTILSIKDGKIMGYNLDTVKSHVMDESNTLPELTDEQASELKEILKGLFNKLS